MKEEVNDKDGGGRSSSSHCTLVQILTSSLLAKVTGATTVISIFLYITIID